MLPGTAPPDADLGTGTGPDTAPNAGGAGVRARTAAQAAPRDRRVDGRAPEEEARNPRMYTNLGIAVQICP
ncbi:hypothetical protein Srubr_71780 [Streptomyces rubradiris]|uniref:Uncharacterized protein n=1 Tax=Streptomyces rubradiris TaxID=285531 RepID=A0ABQ3RNI4_STRRR|nr:hypothetical protein GCM10018792_17280 [Streptomyces rubradiris]GHI57332.1 hypothetical protein Srubr_71780 [Streptomyces rubradiris]